MRLQNTLTDAAVIAELGARLRNLRLERRWTQADLALAAGLPKRTVERLEAGTHTGLSALLRVLRAFGLLENLEALVPETGPGPIDLLERRGRPRQRVRHSGMAEPPPKPWTWGDD